VVVSPHMLLRLENPEVIVVYMDFDYLSPALGKVGYH
jgi:hypothetical protein